MESLWKYFHRNRMLHTQHKSLVGFFKTFSIWLSNPSHLPVLAAVADPFHLCSPMVYDILQAHFAELGYRSYIIFSCTANYLLDGFWSKILWGSYLLVNLASTDKLKFVAFNHKEFMATPIIEITSPELQKSIEFWKDYL